MAAMAANDIPRQMKACQIVEFNKPYKIHQIETPDPSSLGHHDLLVKVAVASLCHTDSMASAGIMGSPLPCTASHEGSGTVAAAGSSVKEFEVGDRVMCGLAFHPCGKCDDCNGPEHQKQYCLKGLKYVGITANGCFAEYVVVDSRTTAKLPNEVSFLTAAPLACAGCTVFRGVLQADLQEGQWLGIVGSGGGLGHLGIQFAKALKLNIIAVDARDEGLELSRQYMGKGQENCVLDARDKDYVSKIHAVINDPGDQEHGVHATLNLSDANTAAKSACEITRMHGTVIQIAQPEQVSIPFYQIVFRDIRIRGSLISSPNEARQMLDIVAKHNITVSANAFGGLDEIPKLIDLAHSGKMKGKGLVIVDKQQIEEEKKLAR